MVAYAEIEHVLGLLEHDHDFQSAITRIRPGELSRNGGGDAFRTYRLYNAALKTFTEDEDLMRAISADPMLRICFFRAFGYRGQLDFSVMPAVALRDLPLLDIGEGVHLGYGVSIGSEVGDGPAAVMLDCIELGPRCFFNQHAIIEAGVSTGTDCAVGIRGTLSRGCQLGDRVDIGDFATIGEAAILGSGVRIGHGARVGAGAIVDDGIRVPDGGEVPAHHRLTKGGLFPRPHRRMAA